MAACAGSRWNVSASNTRVDAAGSFRTMGGKTSCYFLIMSACAPLTDNRNKTDSLLFNEFGNGETFVCGQFFTRAVVNIAEVGFRSEIPNIWQLKVHWRWPGGGRVSAVNRQDIGLSQQTHSSLARTEIKNTCTQLLDRNSTGFNTTVALGELFFHPQLHIRK